MYAFNEKFQQLTLGKPTQNCNGNIINANVKNVRKLSVMFPIPIVTSSTN